MGRIEGNVSESGNHSDRDSERTGLPPERGKIPTDSHSGNDLARSRMEYGTDENQSSPRKGRKIIIRGRTLAQSGDRNFQKRNGKSIGVDGFHSSDLNREYRKKKTSKPSTKIMEWKKRIRKKIFSRPSSSRPEMVDISSQHNGLGFNENRPSYHTRLDGCIRERLGSPYGGRKVFIGNVDQIRNESAHKCVSNSSSSKLSRIRHLGKAYICSSLYRRNLTTMYAINKNGSTTSREITGVVRQLRELCKERNVQISMLRIPGVQNVIADSLSRGVMMPGEWELHPEDWNKICEWIPGWLKYA